MITVSDGTTATSLPAFGITVHANSTPVISGAPAAGIAVGELYSFKPAASDAEGQSLRFSIRNKPSWAYFSWSNGRLYGRPSSNATGTYSNIVITVSDGTRTAALPAFAISVRASGANVAPTLAGTPATQVVAEQPYAFQPTAADADNDTLTFSVTGAPSWATFSSQTGRLSGTPASAAVGSYGPVTISVSDGTAVTALPAFSVAVQPKPNTAPTISGTPATLVTAGQSYVFQPTASDVDGQALRFGIANKPAWASFDLVTGRLSGTPTAAGYFSNIVVSVSDGTASATLAPFAVTVNALGSADLSWTPPTQNDDGSALTDLAGYRIRYGTSPTVLNQVVTIPNPAIMTAAIEGLAAGTWYFSVVSYNHTGVESDPSAPVFKSVM